MQVFKNNFSVKSYMSLRVVYIRSKYFCLVGGSFLLFFFYLKYCAVLNIKLFLVKLKINMKEFCQFWKVGTTNWLWPLLTSQVRTLRYRGFSNLPGFLQGQLN